MALRVLVVDDSPVMRSYIHRVLNLSGMGQGLIRLALAWTSERSAV
jgi:chemotaxis response regulator CheB